MGLLVGGIGEDLGTAVVNMTYWRDWDPGLALVNMTYWRDCLSGRKSIAEDVVGGVAGQ